jgi:cellulose synthase/poly-beta-1,6-N-acetylglucosamine synthase-like glycosyltransferase
MYEIVQVVYGVCMNDGFISKIHEYIHSNFSADEIFESFDCDMIYENDYINELWEEIFDNYTTYSYHGNADHITKFIAIDMNSKACFSIVRAKDFITDPTPKQIEQFTSLIARIKKDMPILRDFDFGQPDVYIYGSSS